MILTILIIFLFSPASSTSPHHHHHHRRILHQPLFPTISVPPPTSAPQTQPKPQRQQPKLPFSSTSTSPPSPPKSFFPTYHSPPTPPSPTVIATFPANISSLLLPSPITHKHRPATAIAVSLTLFSLSLLLASAAFAYHRHRTPHTISSTVADDDNDDDKASIPDNLRLFPPNTTTSDAVDRKRRGNSSSGSEVFYLGTMASSEDAKESAESSCGANDDFRQRYLKLGDSPELNPLPPLPRHNFRAWTSEDKKTEDEEGEEEEQFYSPNGSSPRNKQHSPLSSPPVANATVAATSSRSLNVYKFGSRSFTSRTPSYPHSNNSLSRSSSLNLSPAESVKSLPPHNSASPSFSSSSSSPKAREELSLNSQATKLPPPPPPLPPRFWETPVAASLQNVNVVGVGNENEETSKPKLKALHWDKVKASSDRAMVWDRLRPSSFQ